MTQGKKTSTPISRYLLIGLLIAVIAGFILTSIPKPTTKSANIDVSSSTPKNITFTKDGTLEIFKMGGDKVTELDIEVAETDAERAQGMMYRQSLGGNEGMLFIFDQERPQSFWMKNTYVPLDIIFIDQNWRIVDQYLGAEPKSIKSIQSRRPCTYVLEVNAGFCRAYNTGPGMTVEFKRN